MPSNIRLRFTSEKLPLANQDITVLFEQFKCGNDACLLFESHCPETKQRLSATLCIHPLLCLEVRRLEDHFELHIRGQGALAYRGTILRKRFSRPSRTALLPEIMLRIQTLLTGSIPEIRLFGFSNYEALELCDTCILKLREDQDPVVMRYQVFADVVEVTSLGTHLHQTFSSTPNHETYERICDGPSRSAQSQFALLGLDNSSLDAASHRNLVCEAQNFLSRGDVFQIVLSRRDQYKVVGDSFALYRRLSDIEPSPFHYFLNYPDRKLGGASPELHLKVTEDRACIAPIAGTCTHGQEAQLLQDPKELAEHIMLVDLARNDLSRFCRHVRADEIGVIRRFSRVSHLTSSVSGNLRDPKNRFHLFASSFPAGTLTGAPKLRAMELIDSLEPCARGFYGGAIGHFCLDGRSEHAITIRSFEQRGTVLTLQAGSGIVAASRADREYLEIENKLAALSGALLDFAEPQSSQEPICYAY